MRNPQFYVSGKRPIPVLTAINRFHQFHSIDNVFQYQSCSKLMQCVTITIPPVFFSPVVIGYGMSFVRSVCALCEISRMISRDLFVVTYQFLVNLVVYFTMFLTVVTNPEGNWRHRAASSPQMYIWGLWHPKQYLRQGKVSVSQSILWDAISYSCLRYPFLTPKSLYISWVALHATTTLWYWLLISNPWWNW